MNKKDAIKKLASLEVEMQKLKKIIESPEELIGRITTYSQVCEELGEVEVCEEDFDAPDYMIQKLVVFAKIQQIAKLFNGSWVPDWTNHNEYKYYPWFEMKASGGVGFGVSAVYFSGFDAGVAYYKTLEISDYVGKTFVDIYKKLI